jgi:N-acetylmuramoyl-L-alanine amidase
MRGYLLCPFEHILHMTATIYGEARGETYKGMLAVGWVIRNRAENPSWWGKDVKSVCTKPYQFSCWNDSDPNSKTVRDIATNPLSKVLDVIVARECLQAALEAVGLSEDPTNGANSYHTIAITPKWAEGRTPLITIGHHKFYKL